MSDNKRYKIVYCTPALYMAGGVERVLTLKANYFVEHFGYDITIILTEGKDKPLFYPLSKKIKVINLNIGFEELWSCSFVRKIFVYLKKQRRYKKLLTVELMRLQPDVTVSLLRREINFINDIKDGSRKVGEMHINRDNYRNYNTEDASIFQRIFAKVWSDGLVSKLKQLNKLVVLTESDKESWIELDNVEVIPDPLSLDPRAKSLLTANRVVAVARYSHEKGIDLLLQAWAKVENIVDDWRLDVYGDGDRSAYEQLLDSLQISRNRCQLHARTDDVEKEYLDSGLFVLSSRFEGFGMVITEAMVCGLPVVAFDCPWGPRNIISDGEDGLLVENGNVEKLAEALIIMIQHPEMRGRMATKAVENVQRFKIDQIAELWKSLFDSL